MNEVERTPNRESHGHPFVSESHEGHPIFEGVIFLVVIASALVAISGNTMAATVIVSVAAIVSGVLRLILRKKSPWKVRSVAFDSFIGICLGVGLLLTYLSIQLLL
ncbi:DUF3017 domain-containing protein [Bifidobacterium indicum]|nr:DUF3017 domain-containing protein [Bifidobacterium indicum]